MENTYLIHYGKGEKSKKATYTDRIWENGRWKYIYDDTVDKRQPVNDSNSNRRMQPGEEKRERYVSAMEQRANNSRNQGNSRREEAEAKRQHEMELRNSRRKLQRDNIGEKVQNDRYEAANKAIASGREKEAENRRKQVEDNAKDFSDDRTLNTYDQSTDRVKVYNAKKNVDKFVKTLSIPFKQVAANMDHAYRLLKTWMSTPSVSSKRR